MANGNGNDLSPGGTSPAMSYSFGGLPPAAASRGQLATGLAPPLSEAFSIPYDPPTFTPASEPLPGDFEDGVAVGPQGELTPTQVQPPPTQVQPSQQGQSSARYVSPVDMAGMALTNLAGRAADAFYQGVVKPIGQVYTGEVTPSMEPGPNLLSVPEYAGNLAINALGVRGMGFAAPEGSMGMFAGAKALRSPHVPIEQTMQLNNAMGLYNAGYDMDHIFAETGWFKNPDGKWRFIVPDTGARLKTENLIENENVGNIPGDEQYTTYKIPQSPLTLGDVLDHPTLYDTYPWLKKVPVKELQLLPGDSARGAFNPYRNDISLAELREPDMLSSLLHEVQHAVQNHEGFARGGSSREFLPKDYNKNLIEAARQNDEAENAIKAAGQNPREIAGGLGLHPYVQPINSWAHKALALPDDVINDFIIARGKLKLLQAQKDKSIQDYLNLAGEVEARATQEMHRSGRYNELPKDVGVYEAHSKTGGRGRPYPDPGQQIIMYDQSGKAFSATPVEGNPFAPEGP